MTAATSTTIEMAPGTVGMAMACLTSSTIIAAGAVAVEKPRGGGSDVPQPTSHRSNEKPQEKRRWTQNAKDTAGATTDGEKEQQRKPGNGRRRAPPKSEHQRKGIEE
ncbi:hypothetical protein TcBrA4_0053840 [Trypanosoma cruzi]|nr:hypothetical protein TcBrA4_0053840 [Trypanosoma cruzi]